MRAWLATFLAVGLVVGGTVLYVTAEGVAEAVQEVQRQEAEGGLETTCSGACGLLPTFTVLLVVTAVIGAVALLVRACQAWQARRGPVQVTCRCGWTGEADSRLGALMLGGHHRRVCEVRHD